MGYTFYGCYFKLSGMSEENKVKIGDKTYTFVNEIVDKDNNIQIAADPHETEKNLYAVMFGISDDYHAGKIEFYYEPCTYECPETGEMIDDTCVKYRYKNGRSKSS